MCGRIVLASSPESFGIQLDAVPVGPAATRTPSYNVGPTSDIYAVIQSNQLRPLELMHWGLIPFWAKDPTIGKKLFNARSETLTEKPSFRAAFKYRRCLIPIDGFYEWRKAGTRKQPFLFYRPDQVPLVLAGLWEEWLLPDSSPLRSCTILTIAANAMMQEYHDRMPLVLPKSAWDTWLDPDLQDPKQVSSLLMVPPDEALACHAVAASVGNVRSDFPELMQPL